LEEKSEAFPKRCCTSTFEQLLFIIFQIKSLQPPRFLDLITHSCLLWKYVLKSRISCDDSAEKIKTPDSGSYEKLQHQKCLNVFETRLPVTLISGLLQEMVGYVISFIQL